MLVARTSLLQFPTSPKWRIQSWPCCSLIWTSTLCLRQILEEKSSLTETRYTSNTCWTGLAMKDSFNPSQIHMNRKCSTRNCNSGEFLVLLHSFKEHRLTCKGNSSHTNLLIQALKRSHNRLWNTNPQTLLLQISHLWTSEIYTLKQVEIYQVNHVIRPLPPHG